MVSWAQTWSNSASAPTPRGLRLLKKERQDQHKANSWRCGDIPCMPTECEVTCPSESLKPKERKTGPESVPLLTGGPYKNGSPIKSQMQRRMNHKRTFSLSGSS